MGERISVAIEFVHAVRECPNPEIAVRVLKDFPYAVVTNSSAITRIVNISNEILSIERVQPSEIGTDP